MAARRRRLGGPPRGLGSKNRCESGPHLLVDRGAAVRAGHVEPGAERELGRLLVDLDRELARRREHERGDGGAARGLARRAVLEQVPENGQREGQGLAGAGLRGPATHP
jgi:hypothetical protein